MALALILGGLEAFFGVFLPELIEGVSVLTTHEIVAAGTELIGETLAEGALETIPEVAINEIELPAFGNVVDFVNASSKAIGKDIGHLNTAVKVGTAAKKAFDGTRDKESKN